MHIGEPPVRGQMAPLRVPEMCPQEVADLQLRCVSHDPVRWTGLGGRATTARVSSAGCPTLCNGPHGMGPSSWPA